MMRLLCEEAEKQLCECVCVRVCMWICPLMRGWHVDGFAKYCLFRVTCYATRMAIRGAHLLGCIWLNPFLGAGRWEACLLQHIHIQHLIWQKQCLEFGNSSVLNCLWRFTDSSIKSVESDEHCR